MEMFEIKASRKYLFDEEVVEAETGKQAERPSLALRWQRASWPAGRRAHDRITWQKTYHQHRDCQMHLVVQRRHPCHIHLKQTDFYIKL
uniref:Uncharacterized protein n=1 Tax=Romanomermis culicivorax TaxID=13658 RepID=A0A915JC86_ROMCU